MRETLSVRLFASIVLVALLHGNAARAETPSSATNAFPPLPSLAHATWPADGPWKEIEPNVRSMTLDIANAAGLKTRLFIYLPAQATATNRVPCVFIAPAGSRLWHGMELADGDVPEHLPYVRAGMAVIAYSVGGPLAKAAEGVPAGMRHARELFRRSQAGFVDAEAAIAYAKANRPEVDFGNLFVAGHSSAGTVALTVAAEDPRVRACCAYAPAVDIEASLSRYAAPLEKVMPGCGSFERAISPMNLPPPKGDVLLFHADDDTNVPAADIERYAKQLGDRAKLVTVPTGGHFQSMIEKGIPAGVAFLKERILNPTPSSKP